MNTFMDLYYYECKKIWDRKLTKVSFIICLIIAITGIIMPLFGSYVVEGQVVGTVYDEIQIDQTFARALNGKEINQQLLEEMVSAYRTIPKNPNKHYTLTSEYQTNARPYSQIFNFVVGTTDLNLTDIFLNWEPDEQDLYKRRIDWLKSIWEQKNLSEKEISFWERQEAKIKKPLVYQEHESYSQLFNTFQSIGFAAILFVSISLSGIFPDEHSRKTDQLVLSSFKGRKNIYWAKISAGISYAAGAVAGFFLIILSITFIMYGNKGFDAAFQLEYQSSSDSVSCGQALLIAYGIMLVTVILISVTVMILSELIHSNVGALAISFLFLIVPMFINIPSYYKIAAQIFEWFPWTVLYIPYIFGKYTLSIAGIHFTPWQAVPIIYLIMGTIIAVFGEKIYKKYQVSGR